MPTPNLIPYTDGEIADGLARLPVARVEHVARLLIAQLSAEGKEAIARAYLAAPTMAGAAAASIVERAVQRALKGAR